MEYALSGASHIQLLWTATGVKINSFFFRTNVNLITFSVQIMHWCNVMGNKIERYGRKGIIEHQTVNFSLAALLEVILHIVGTS